MKKTIWSLALLCLASQFEPASALDVNTKMGKPTQEELTMTTYDPDPEAEAVVLYSSRYSCFDLRSDGFSLASQYKKRIKILKEEGKSQGDVEIVVYDDEDGGRDNLSGIKGFTYNLENGSVVKSKLTAEMRSEQRADQYFKVIKLSMPNVQVGSVIELEYEIRSNGVSTIDPWYAQEDIPVFYTIYEVQVPEWFTFSHNTTGYGSLKVTKKPESYTASLGGQTLHAAAETEIYEGRELPRLKDDDFVMCINDFSTKVVKDITNYTIPGVVYKTYNQDWNHEIGDLMKSSYFGKLVEGNDPLAAEVKAIQWPADFTLAQKVDSLRQLLWSNYTWDGSYNLYARSKSVLNKEKQGSSATLNFALLNMLADAGIKAYPVVMNNRRTGRLTGRPSRKYLKAMVVAVCNEDDSTYTYVDAGSRNFAVGYLPKQLLVPQAFILKPESEKFTTRDLREVSKGTLISNSILSLSADGLLSGARTVNHRGLDAADFRNSYKTYSDEQEYVDRLAADCDVEVSDYRIENVNATTESVKEYYNIARQLDVEGDHIYLQPFLCIDMHSPFVEETRTLPVEYGYEQTLKHNISIQLPENYVVEEMPANLNMKMPDGKLVARINCRATGNIISVSVNITCNTLFYPASDYELLRGIYAAIQQASSSRIVLKRQS